MIFLFKKSISSFNRFAFFCNLVFFLSFCLVCVIGIGNLVLICITRRKWRGSWSCSKPNDHNQPGAYPTGYFGRKQINLK
ncbi:hypothetical protein CI102_2112 [Trichoderma harzianum]|nr:hypothetical protein CI102_2112 [Trichoderma harzianum]